ncbi:MAG: polysaccharide deacetylase family protein [Planctomycetes bacterium]|nr:polysaccharide deacetylase family protein [Planctomycetota bacterium]
MRPKALIKRAMCGAGRFAAGSGPRTVVLCYHSVSDDAPYASATPALFERHLAWLGEHCDVVGFADSMRPGHSGRTRVAITFDDGYADNHALLDLLERMRMRATFFLTTGLIDRDPAVIAHFARQRACPESAVHALTWSQAIELRRAGHAIGAHTRTHPNLATLTSERAEEELRRAKDDLESQLGEPVPALAWPYGKPGRHFTAANLASAARLGHGLGAAVLFRGVRADDSHLAVPRFFIAHDPVEDLAAKVRGDWDWLGHWQSAAPRWLAKLVSPRDFDAAVLGAG